MPPFLLGFLGKQVLGKFSVGQILKLAAVAAVVGWIGFLHIRVSSLKADLAEEKASHTETKADYNQCKANRIVLDTNLQACTGDLTWALDKCQENSEADDAEAEATVANIPRWEPGQAVELITPEEMTQWVQENFSR